MRLFVAVWPSPAVIAALAALERPDIGGVRWTVPAQWHVTLRFLGNVDEADVPALCDAISDAVAPHVRRECVVGPATATFGRTILIVPVSGLDDLAAATVTATSMFGEPPDERPFAGHLTLARSRRRNRSGADLRPFAGETLSASWTVDEVTLVRSVSSRAGVTYDVLARFGLT